MSLSNKLARWEAAGLLDAATRERIEAFEQQRRKPVVLYAMAALGAGTIALGLVSIVAANWDAISANVKLACDLLLGAALAAGTYYAARRKLSLAVEILVTVYYGFTLASLSLVGQIYQLGTPIYQALLLWTIVTLPLVLLGQSRYLGGLIVYALATTHGYVLEAIFDYVQREPSFSEATERNLLAPLLFVAPLLYVLAGRISWLLRQRPEYALMLRYSGWIAVLLGGFALQFAWYASITAGETLSWGLLLIAMLAAGFVALLLRTEPLLVKPAQLGLSLAIGFAVVTLALATSFPREGAAFIGAILQVVWLVLAAWTAVQLGMLRTFNALTALLALRVLVVYFEVFGSLLDTGLGLLTGGALTLLMAWLWRHKTRDLAERFAPKAGGTDHVA